MVSAHKLVCFLITQMVSASSIVRKVYFKFQNLLSCLMLGILLMVCALVQGQVASRYAHPFVLRNAELEATLPSRFLNPFYQDFQIRRALARSSWFGPNEQPVYTRATDSISRRDIFTALNHAGLLPQQQIRRANF